MKLYLESVGYKADGFEVGLDRIKRVGLPVIVLIETRGYKHFVVVKGARAGHVLVGDPARGMLKMSEEQFLAEWKNGLAFAIHNANEIGRRYFDSDEEWRRLPPSPLGSAVSRATLASFSVMLPGITESFFH
jgi:predicted double-glycine peptidase